MLLPASVHHTTLHQVNDTIDVLQQPLQGWLTCLTELFHPLMSILLPANASRLQWLSLKPPPVTYPRFLVLWVTPMLDLARVDLRELSAWPRPPRKSYNTNTLILTFILDIKDPPLGRNGFVPLSRYLFPATNVASVYVFARVRCKAVEFSEYFSGT